MGTPNSSRGPISGAIEPTRRLSTTSLKDQYLASIKSYNLLAAYQPYWDKYGKPQFPDEPSLLDYPDLTK